MYNVCLSGGSVGGAVAVGGAGVPSPGWPGGGDTVPRPGGSQQLARGVALGMGSCRDPQSR